MKIIIAGGRDYVLHIKHIKEIDNILRRIDNITEFVSGGCQSGADNLNEFYSLIFKKLPIKYFLPDWNKYGIAAGPIRNEEMAKYVGSSGGCILLPGGRGTVNMRKLADKYNLKIWEIQ